MSYETVLAVLDSGPKCPVSGLIIDVIEHQPGHFSYRLYRDNFEDYSDPQKASVFEWIKGRAEAAVKLGGAAGMGLEMAEYPSNPNGESNE